MDCRREGWKQELGTITVVQVRNDVGVECGDMYGGSGLLMDSMQR